MVSYAKAVNSQVSPDFMVGKTDFDFMSHEDAKRCWEDDQKVMENDVPIRDKEEKLISRHDGTERWVSVSKFPWKNSNGEIVGIIGISRDITTRVIYKKHLLNMLSIAAHDMRGPLVSISSTLKLLSKGSFGKIVESVKLTLNDLYGRVNKLTGIVSEYLNKSSLLFIDSGIPEKEEFDLRQDIIDTILEELSQDIEDKKIVVDNSLGAIPGNKITIEANKRWINIVYRNLISNAIKYGDDESTIAFGFEDKGDHYRLNVYNSGPTVPVEYREKIFEMFETQDKKSTGVGLSIARDLIRRHGGDMWYEDSIDGHPNFVFTLPK